MNDTNGILDVSLQHHGILGMKWGVRRSPAQLGHDTGDESESSNGKARQRNPSRKPPEDRQETLG